MKNNVNRDIPQKIIESEKYKLFENVNSNKTLIKIVGPTIRKFSKDSKVSSSLEDVIKKVLKNDMTISFHHHFREGDYVFNKVMRIIIDLGYKNITIAPSSLTNVMNDILIEAVESGTVTNITSSGMRGELGNKVSHGIMENPVIFRSHGGRARAIKTGDIKIDIAFLGTPNSDNLGNANGMNGDSAFGSLGYALIDAQYADTVVILTDNLVPYPNTPASIKQTQVDYVVKIDAVGDPDKIASGATRFTKDPKELKIASLVNKVITNSPYFKNGFSFQTGTGGSSLAVTRFLRSSMIDAKVSASFGLGGITKPMVELLEEGLIGKLLDVQDFDGFSAKSMKANNNQQEIDASWYADPFNKSAVVDNLDFSILSALEVDTKFNVNVMSGSDGIIRGAIGGHQDSATAKMTIIAAPLVRGRLATIVPEVSTVVTPGESIDVVVTEIGIAINPQRVDLLDIFKYISDIPIYPIDELQKIAENKLGSPQKIEFKDKIVALVEYRDGSLIDIIREVRD